MPVKFFPNQTEFRNWLLQNHNTATELLVGYYKVGSGKPSLSWSQSVDQALCFGWIDSVRNSIDNESYCIRFTPRKPTSIWSDVNIAKVKTLTEQGLMTPAGLLSFEKRKDVKSGIYSYENAEISLTPDFEKLFKANKIAWNYFNTLTPTYRKASTKYVMSAKQEATKLKRLQELINDSAAGTNKWRDNKYSKK